MGNLISRQQIMAQSHMKRRMAQTVFCQRLASFARGRRYAVQLSRYRRQLGSNLYFPTQQLNFTC